MFDKLSKEKNMNDKKERNKEIREWILLFVICFAVVFVVRAKVILVANVPTGSMLETIQLEDKVLGNRLAYKTTDPKRGEIIMFHAPDDGELYIKRLIGLPGEKVTIDNAQIYIDDSSEPLKENYLPEKWVDENDDFVFEVPEDSYLFLGDNRNESFDARDWENTYVSREDIVAKAEVIYFPLKDVKFLSGYEY